MISIRGLPRAAGRFFTSFRMTDVCGFVLRMTDMVVNGELPLLRDGDPHVGWLCHPPQDDRWGVV